MKVAGMLALNPEALEKVKVPGLKEIASPEFTDIPAKKNRYPSFAVISPKVVAALSITLFTGIV